MCSRKWLSFSYLFLELFSCIYTLARSRYAMLDGRIARQWLMGNESAVMEVILLGFGVFDGTY